MEILTSDQIIEHFENVSGSICLLAWDIGECCDNSSPMLYTFKNTTELYFHLKNKIGSDSMCLYDHQTDRYTKNEPLVDINDEMAIISFIIFKYDGLSYKISKRNYNDVKNVVMSFVK